MHHVFQIANVLKVEQSIVHVMMQASVPVRAKWVETSVTIAYQDILTFPLVKVSKTSISKFLNVMTIK